MAIDLPHWAFALLPLFLFSAALFWGAPAIALVSELIGMAGGKPFPGRCARQTSRLAAWGHLVFWLLIVAGTGLTLTRTTQAMAFLTNNVLLLALGMALPFFGSLVLIAYDLTWKKAKERRMMHFLLGCLANVGIKYGYWGLVAVALVIFRGLPINHPAFLPPWNSALWPLAALWLPLSLALAAGLGLVYVLLRRERDDWGRDYYRFAPPFLGKWQIAGAVMTLVVLAWLFFSLKGIFNLFLPQIFYAAAGGAAGLGLSALLSLALCLSDNPMRLKGTMLGVVFFSYLASGLLLVAILETLNRYVPGWSIPTFMPEVLRLLR